jgi:hypothetical protein
MNKHTFLASQLTLTSCISERGSLRVSTEKLGTTNFYVDIFRASSSANNVHLFLSSMFALSEEKKKCYLRYFAAHKLQIHHFFRLSYPPLIIPHPLFQGDELIYVFIWGDLCVLHCWYELFILPSHVSPSPSPPPLLLCITFVFLFVLRSAKYYPCCNLCGNLP